MPPGESAAGYKRVLIKISGEALMGTGEFGIDSPAIKSICSQLCDAKQPETQIGVVVGGGNIIRGMHAAERGMDRTTADNMGMLATVINSLSMADTLEKMGVTVRVMSAVEIGVFAETYVRRRAIRHLERGRLVIFAAGTGSPYFSTDTAAALRAREIGAEILIKATNVDGVYSVDPKTSPDAVFYPHVSYMEVLTQQLKVIDATAISLLMEGRIPVRVIDIKPPGNLRRVVLGNEIGTLIS